MRHPSLASVEWQDLRQLSLGATVYNIFLSLPFFIIVMVERVARVVVTCTCGDIFLFYCRTETSA